MSVWSLLRILACAAIAPACSFDRTGFNEADGGDSFDDGGGPFDAALFDAPPPPDRLEVGHARLIYGVGGATRLQNLHRFDDGAWATEPQSDDVGGGAPWVVHRIGPTDAADEFAMTVLGTDDGPEASVRRLAEGRWTTEWSVIHGLAVSTAARGFDLEFEESGDALAVYGIGTDTPAYRIYTAGEWSAERIVPLNDGNPNPNPDTNAGVVRWVELDRRPGTDEIALAFSDDRETLVAMIWNGDVWELDSATTLDDRLKVNPSTSVVSNRVFDAALESISGDLVVAWGRQNASGFDFSVFDAVTRTWSAPVNLVIISGTPHYVDLAPDPATDQIVGGFYDLGDGTERLGVGVWNGLSWIDTLEVDSQISNVNDGAIGDFPGEVTFLHGTGHAVAVYADDNSGQMSYARWEPGFSWAVQVPLTVPTMGQARSYDLAVLPGGDAALVVVSDDSSRLFAGVLDDAAGEFILDDSRAQLTSDLLSTMSTPFSVDVRAQ